MIKYPKIQSIYCRDEKTHAFTDQYSSDELYYLSNCKWIGEEKIDGMNVTIWPNYETNQLMVMGRNLQPTVPTQLLERIHSLIKYWQLVGLFQDKADVILYGEGCGYKIQTNGHIYVYGNIAQDFILFDIRIGHIWLKRIDVVRIGSELGLNVSREVFSGTLAEASESVKCLQSSYDKAYKAEGLVLRPEVTMIDRRGNRIITKVKAKDFE